ncbi:hypothetical protein AURDEDRAFT_176280 [Auricularia subglabra TFB-10046 SS5]|uniref:Uncharacterized protein n=1 Tax=Auricularia subglabra (strain TFB-10046 / SS5) TaxID=717982 RepID=J0CW08_AURST|nr:hypothetical protein AURDEDRAFT_176280 [Auricularia subglabra TFB-10046 SS5]
MTMWGVYTGKCLLRISEIECVYFNDIAFLGNTIAGAAGLSVTVLSVSGLLFELEFPDGSNVFVSYMPLTEQSTTTRLTAGCLTFQPSYLSQLRTLRMTDTMLSEFLRGSPRLASLVSLSIDARLGQSSSIALQRLAGIHAPRITSLTISLGGIDDNHEGAKARRFLANLETCLHKISRKRDLRVVVRGLPHIAEVGVKLPVVGHVTITLE